MYVRTNYDFGQLIYVFIVETIPGYLLVGKFSLSRLIRYPARLKINPITCISAN